jgi:cytochrome P450
VLGELSARHGDVVRIPHPGCRLVLLAHPDDIHAVLATKAHYFHIFGQNLLRRVTPWGLVATEGQVHDDNRSRMMLAMRKILSRRVPDAAAKACRRCLDGLRDGDVIDVRKLAQDVTLGVATSLLYPSAGDSPAANLDHAEFAALLSRSSAWLLGFPTAVQWAVFAASLPTTIRTLRLHASMRRQVRVAMAAARDAMSSAAAGDMLSLLVDGSETGGAMVEEFLADNILNLLLAAYETSGNALAWALWETSKDPALQDRIAGEAASLHDDPGAHDAWMNGAHWVDATLRETLRLFPSVWTLCRRAHAEYRIGDWLFPAGTVFMVSQWVTQRDSRWFSEPLRFAPDRWVKERLAVVAGQTDAVRRPSFAYFPFGGGNRFCIGKGTFEFEGSMLLAAFFRDWIAEPLPDCRPRPVFFATMRPAGAMLVRVRRR